MFKKIKSGLKGVKQFMDKKIEACKEIFSNRENRLTAGIVLGGLSMGLIISAYVTLPA